MLDLFPAINAGMVVTLDGAALQNTPSEVEAEDGSRTYAQSMGVLSNDDSPVKVVKVDQLENQDLGSPL